MSLRFPRLARLRLLSEIHFAFGGALVGGLAGLALAAVTLVVAPHRIVPEPAFYSHYRRIATGGGAGWVGGLLWCWLLAMHARRLQPPAPSSTLMPATWLAAGSSLAVEVAALYAGLPEGWALGLAVVLATLAARAWVAARARRSA